MIPWNSERGKNLALIAQIGDDSFSIRLDAALTVTSVALKPKNKQ